MGIGYEPHGLANSRMLSKFLLGLEYKKMAVVGCCVGVGYVGGAVLGS